MIGCSRRFPVALSLTLLLSAAADLTYAEELRVQVGVLVLGGAWRVYVNDNYVGTTSPSKEARTVLAPGKHLLTISPPTRAGVDWVKNMEVHIGPGECVSVRWAKQGAPVIERARGSTPHVAEPPPDTATFDRAANGAAATSLSVPAAAVLNYVDKLVSRGDWEQARDELAKLKDVPAELTEKVLLLSIRVHVGLGNTEEAVREIDKFLSYFPRSPSLSSVKAIVFELSGDANAAIAQVELKSTDGSKPEYDTVVSTSHWTWVEKRGDWGCLDWGITDGRSKRGEWTTAGCILPPGTYRLYASRYRNEYDGTRQGSRKPKKFNDFKKIAFTAERGKVVTLEIRYSATAIVDISVKDTAQRNWETEWESLSRRYLQ